MAARSPRVDEAIELVHGGMTQKEAAERMGVSRSAIQHRLHPQVKAASERRRRAKKREWERANRKTCACGKLAWRTERCIECYEREAMLVELWRQGLPIKDIAAAVGYTPGGLAARIPGWRRMGIDLPYRHRRKK
jgi:predicted transcriptional regulator